MLVPETAMIQFSVLIVSGIALVAMVTLLVQCVCGKKEKKEATAENVQSPSGHTSVFLDADALCKLQENQGDTNGEQNVDITPLNMSLGSNNGTLHSRGNSVDLNKDGRSGASCGSSPRPTLSRELPNIPGSHADRGHHSTLPTLPSDTRITSMLESYNSKGAYSSTLDSQRKSSHLHTHLPDLPNGASTMSDIHRTSTGTGDSVNIDHKSDIDDYDHIVEKKEKKARPRSDYDHVVIENGERRIIPAKSKLQENDYAEVKNGGLYEQVDGDVSDVTVIPLATSTHNKQTNPSNKHVTKVDSFNDPYNKIKVDVDPPYNRIKDDPPYNKIKENANEGDTLFMKMKDDAYNIDDPYNTVKELQDDLDPYNTVNDGTSTSGRSSVRKKMEDTSFKVSTPVYDPYSMMADEERNVSNQTDPYARVGDTESELDDPYNKVVDDIVPLEHTAGYGDDDYATVNKANEIEYAKVNKNLVRNLYTVDDVDTKNASRVDSSPSASRVDSSPSASRVESSPSASRVDSSPSASHVDSSPSASRVESSPSPREEIIHDEYATVVKVRKLSPSYPGPSIVSSDTSRTERTSQSSTGNLRISSEFPVPQNANTQSQPSTQNSGSQSLPTSQNSGSQSQSVTQNIASQSLPSSQNSGSQPQTTTQNIGSQSQPSTQNGARNIVSSVARNNPSNVSGGHVIPPEPPRDYDDNATEEIDHYNTVALVTRDNSTRSSVGKKEPPYNKLSVRESLASMNARAASNTYEYVSDTDNLYATVDGSSGDGQTSVQRKLPHTIPETVPAIVDAPAPPSLDSLHETAKQHQDEIRRKHDSKPDYYNLDTPTQGHVNGHQRTPSGQGHFRTPSGDMMTSSFEGRVPIATEENVELDFDPSYQSVVEDKSCDNVSEFDPNYETVDEAKGKSRYEEINGARPKLIRHHIYEVPDAELKPGETRLENGKIRAHVYEEVKVTNEAGRVRQRVLNKHTYEEVTDIKKKGKKSNHSNNTVSENSKKKNDEKLSSADKLFGKRKSGEPKDDKKKPNDKNEGNHKSGDQSGQ